MKKNDPKVIFSERFATGYSHKSFITRILVATNCLTVILTKSQLTIRTFFPLTLFIGICDLEHQIQLSNITGLENRGKITKIEFNKKDGTSRTISLRLRDTAGFLNALQESDANPASHSS